jgi:hypothetical protein
MYIYIYIYILRLRRARTFQEANQARNPCRNWNYLFKFLRGHAGSETTYSVWFMFCSVHMCPAMQNKRYIMTWVLSPNMRGFSAPGIVHKNATSTHPYPCGNANDIAPRLSLRNVFFFGAQWSLRLARQICVRRLS